MRGLVTFGAAIVCLPGIAQAQGALGANYNEHFEDVDYRDLEKADARWIRLFLPMPQVDRGAAGHGAIKATLDAHAHGIKTILSLKFPYNHEDFPKAGTPAFERELARIDAVLPLVIGKADILVIGNEPYIESPEKDRDLDLNAFYEAMARRVIDYRAKACPGACLTRLYMGALNRLDLKKRRTKSTERWMEFVKATPEIDGVDIHPHVPAIEATKPFLDYILPRMRPEQKFIVTEFSLVWWWQANMTKPVPAAFADKYGAPRTAQNWQIMKAALETPFPKSQWDEFLAQSPWFEGRKHYLRNQMRMFRTTGRLAVATYGFKQGRSMSHGFGPKKVPWLINSVFAPATIRRNADGSAAPNYTIFDDFKALQKGK
jgi:hypothetical protein